jgi:hypothetical protein
LFSFPVLLPFLLLLILFLLPFSRKDWDGGAGLLGVVAKGLWKCVASQRLPAEA